MTMATRTPSHSANPLTAISLQTPSSLASAARRATHWDKDAADFVIEAVDGPEDLTIDFVGHHREERTRRENHHLPSVRE
jgi:hypothetical protein